MRHEDFARRGACCGACAVAGLYVVRLCRRFQRVGSGAFRRSARIHRSDGRKRHMHGRSGPCRLPCVRRCERIDGGALHSIRIGSARIGGFRYIECMGPLECRCLGISGQSGFRWCPFRAIRINRFVHSVGFGCACGSGPARWHVRCRLGGSFGIAGLRGMRAAELRYDRRCSCRGG